jgi:DNA-binding SARP family transcriptional activator/tetratricopeptide (TPR) repeat protein
VESVLEVRVLGPVEVYYGGEPLNLVRRQQRLILGILALQANTRISGDRLIDLLWGERPAPRARAILQSRVSELRAILAGTDVRLCADTGGYLLRIAPERVDAHRFRRVLAGRDAARSGEETRRLLREALILWRGPVLGGQLSPAAHAALGQSLESARLTATEDLYELELRLGNHHEIVDELRALATANPSRERLAALSMLALHRVGRTADALHDYDRWRHWLRDELGVDPGSEVQRVHLSILRGSGEPGRFEAVVPRTLPPDIADFAGRAAEVALLEKVLRERGAVVAVTGRGGIGKTALSVHVAHRVRASFPDGQLSVNLHGADVDEPVDPYDAVGRCLRALGVDGAAMPETLDERVDLYRGLLAERKVLVLLDNAATDDQILPLIPGGPGCGVLVTSRVRLGAVVGARMIGLDVLDPDEATSLLGRVAGAERIAAEPGPAGDVCRRCGHLPLAIRIAAAKLAAKPHWTVAKLADVLRDERGRLSQLTHGHLDVRASIALSYAGLPPDDQRLLLRLGDIDLPEISVWISAALLDTDVPHAEEVLERLFDAQLLDIAGCEATGHARYRMHDLIRLFARERAQSDEPADVLAAARQRAFGAWLTVADAAHTVVFGGRDYQNVRGRAGRWPIDPDLVAELVAGPDRWFELERAGIVAAIRRAAADGLSTVCSNLAGTTGPLFQMRRHFEESQRVCEAVYAVAQATGDRHSEAIALFRLGTLAGDRWQLKSAMDYFVRSRDLLGRLGDAHGRAVADVYIAMHERFFENRDVSIALLEQAYPVLHEYEDHGGEAFALRNLGNAYLELGEYGAAGAWFDRALRLARRCGSRQVEAQALFWRGMLGIRLGNGQPAEDDFREALAITQRLGDRPGEAQCLRGLGLCYQQHGDRERAHATLLQALRMVRQPKLTLMERAITEAIATL